MMWKSSNSEAIILSLDYLSVYFCLCSTAWLPASVIDNKLVFWVQSSVGALLQLFAWLKNLYFAMFLHKISYGKYIPTFVQGFKGVTCDSKVYYIFEWRFVCRHSCWRNSLFENLKPKVHCKKMWAIYRSCMVLYTGLLDILFIFSHGYIG